MNKILLATFLLFALNCLGQKDTRKISIEIWKKDYAKLPFWNKNISQKGSQGYIDTFTINKIHFRIIHNENQFDGIVQIYKSNKWIDNIKFQNLGNHNNYDRTFDLNGDENKDLIFYWKWHGEIYFFDKTKNRFSDTLDCTIDRDWTTLNSKKNIYFENVFGKLINSPVHSNLFTFKNKKRIEIASLEMNFDTNYDTENSGNLTICKLYKHGVKKSIERFSVTNKVAPFEFDLVKYWNKKLKTILGYSQQKVLRQQG